MKNASFVVTIAVEGSARSQIWDGALPLGIGFPYRFVLEWTGAVVRVRNFTAPFGEVQTEAPLELQPRQLEEGARLTLPGLAQDASLTLQIRSKKEIEKPMSIPSLKLEDVAPFLQSRANPDPALQDFWKALRTVSVALVVFTASALFWPKPAPVPREVVPAQFTKILFSKPKTTLSKSASPLPAAPPQAPDLAKQASDTKVVRAFRAKTLQSAMRSLLKGGMTKLLAQSDFWVRGKEGRAGGKLLDIKSEWLRAGTGHSLSGGLKPVLVAAVGGEAGGTGIGLVGYKTGEHAQVVGQGRSQISLDTDGSAVEEGLSKDEVGEVIHRHLSEVRYCYESTLLKTPDLEGKLVVHFQIGGLGAIKTATVQASTLPDPRLDDCILRRLTNWKFPSPKGGIDVAVTYPFIFKTLGR